MNNEVAMSEVDNSKLPAKLQNLPLEKQQAVINQKIEDRKKLQAKMDALVKQRSEFIAAEKAKASPSAKADSFDLNVKTMIRKQGEAKGIKFSK